MKLILALVAGFMMTILAGRAERTTEKTRIALWLINTITLFLLILLLLVSETPNWLLAALVFLSVFILTKETLLIESPAYRGPITATAASNGLATAEITWLAGFLPLNYISVACLATLTSVVLKRVSIARFTGNMKTKFTLKQISIAVITILLIMIGGQWRL